MSAIPLLGTALGFGWLVTDYSQKADAFYLGFPYLRWCILSHLDLCDNPTIVTDAHSAALLHSGESLSLCPTQNALFPP